SARDVSVAHAVAVSVPVDREGDDSPLGAEPDRDVRAVADGEGLGEAQGADQLGGRLAQAKPAHHPVERRGRERCDEGDDGEGHGQVEELEAALEGLHEEIAPEPRANRATPDPPGTVHRPGAFSARERWTFSFSEDSPERLT